MRALIFLALVVLATSLRRKSKSSGPYSALSWKQHFEQYMSKLKNTKDPDGFNENCEPFISSPRGASRGLVLLQHGFSACAGFWYLLEPPLVASGWTVMVPNLIGHGRNPKVQRNGSRHGHGAYAVGDYNDELPTDEGQYEDYSLELVQIARKYKNENPSKEVVLGGISHGGAIAMYMAMNSPTTFDRVLLLNPFMAVPTAIGADFGLSFLRRIVPQELPAFTFVREQITWGQDCDHKRWPTDPRRGGHGGVCQFSLAQFAAVLRFGNVVEAEARARAAKLGVFTGGVFDRLVGVKDLLVDKWRSLLGGGKTPPSNLKLQLLTSSNDPSISNGRIHFASAAIKASVYGANSGYCVFPEEFDHVYIAPKDYLGRDHWWLESSRVVGGKTVIDQLENFLSDGILIPTGSDTVQDDKWVKGDPRCGIQRK